MGSVRTVAFGCKANQYDTRDVRELSGELGFAGSPLELASVGARS